MFEYPYPNPVALDFGAVVVHWYGLMYVVGCFLGWWLGRIQCKWPNNAWTKVMVDDVVFYIAIGMIVGGRIGYMLFYNLDYYIENPVALLRVWQGGMSFHGGLIGVSLSLFLFAKKHKISLFAVTDFVAMCVPPGLGAGRIGNFINSELWGKQAPEGSFWGMRVYDVALAKDVEKYPTQLLEFALEGVALLAILWIIARYVKPRRKVITGLFLIGYAVFRSTVEIWRVPDAHIGYLTGDWLTMGHLLSLPMLLLGIGLIIWAYSKAPAK